jgi:hypothetical protein
MNKVMDIDMYLHLNIFAFTPVFVCVFNLKLRQTLVWIQIQIEKHIEIKKEADSLTLISAQQKIPSRTAHDYIPFFITLATHDVSIT